MQVEGKGTVAVETSYGKVKLLVDVFFVPHFAHSLLSVGQLMADGYAILFNNGECIIKNKFGHPMVNLPMTNKKMFPLKISNMENQALVVSKKIESKSWHL